jgi:hypothetical protein
MPACGPPNGEVMTASSQRLARARALAAVGLVLSGASIVGGCGVPAVIKPSATPLPGLQRDIRAAQNAVAQTERKAQSDAAANVGGP